MATEIPSRNSNFAEFWEVYGCAGMEKFPGNKNFFQRSYIAK